MPRLPCTEHAQCWSTHPEKGLLLDVLGIPLTGPQPLLRITPQQLHIGTPTFISIQSYGMYMLPRNMAMNIGGLCKSQDDYS